VRRDRVAVGIREPGTDRLTVDQPLFVGQFRYPGDVPRRLVEQGAAVSHVIVEVRNVEPRVPEPFELCASFGEQFVDGGLASRQRTGMGRQVTVVVDERRDLHRREHRTSAGGPTRR
jgi:hypothetical protein